jgi:hypothetical protein
VSVHNVSHTGANSVVTRITSYNFSGSTNLTIYVPVIYERNGNDMKNIRES